MSAPAEEDGSTPTPSGIRVTVDFHSPAGCPMARFSADAGVHVESAATNVAIDGTHAVTEFGVRDGPPPEDLALEPIFAYGDARRYRFEHGSGPTCPCERLGRFDCPVDRYVVDNGVLTLDFHAADYDQLRTVVTDLNERFDGMDVRRMIRSAPDAEAADQILLDVNAFTDRQLEVLRTAYDMGFFDRPRRTNKTEVAAELGIATSTLSDHLTAAEHKLVATMFGERGR